MTPSLAALASYAYGIDRAFPLTKGEIVYLRSQGFTIFAYYLPSPEAAQVWTVPEANLLRPSKVMPIMVCPLAVSDDRLEAGELGRRLAASAMFYLGGQVNYPHDGWVALDVEEETTGDVGAVMGGFREFLTEHGMKPVIYSGHSNLENDVPNKSGWLASWFPTQFNHDYPLSTAGFAGWQFAGNVEVPAFGSDPATDLVDLSIWDTTILWPDNERKSVSDMPDMPEDSVIDDVQTQLVPGTYLIAGPADTIESMANTHGVTPEALREANPQLPPNMVSVPKDTTVYLPAAPAPPLVTPLSAAVVSMTVAEPTPPVAGVATTPVATTSEVYNLLSQAADLLHSAMTKLGA